MRVSEFFLSTLKEAPAEAEPVESLGADIDENHIKEAVTNRRRVPPATICKQRAGYNIPIFRGSLRWISLGRKLGEGARLL